MPATIRPAMVEAKAPVPNVRTLRRHRPPGRGRHGPDLHPPRHGPASHAARLVPPPASMNGWAWFSGRRNRPSATPKASPSTASLCARATAATATSPATGRTTRRPNAGSNCSTFSDEDLGPGGAFVTRRGTDPVRMGKEASELKETEIFLSRATFPDLWRHPDDPARAKFVPHALMPLSDTEKDNEAAPSADRAPGRRRHQPRPPDGGRSRHLRAALQHRGRGMVRRRPALARPQRRQLGPVRTRQVPAAHAARPAVFAPRRTMGPASAGTPRRTPPERGPQDAARYGAGPGFARPRRGTRRHRSGHEGTEAVRDRPRQTQRAAHAAAGVRRRKKRRPAAIPGTASR